MTKEGLMKPSLFVLISFLFLIVGAKVESKDGTENKAPEKMIADQKANKTQSQKLKTVGSWLKELKLDLDQAELLDHPTGKLKVLVFKTKDKKQLGLMLDYRSDLLFSENRDWQKENILKASVLEVQSGDICTFSGCQSF